MSNQNQQPLKRSRQAAKGKPLRSGRREVHYKGTTISVLVDTRALPGIEAEAEAPEGHIFSAADTHFVYGSDNCCDAEALERAISGIKRDIDDGFEVCTYEECEICHPPSDDEVGT
jgi:hypothetical protein